MSQQINLYNPIFLKQKKHFSARTMLQALGLIALGVGALCGYAFFESRNAERTARQYTDQVGAQRGQLVQLVARLAAQGSSKALEADIARLQREVSARQSTLNALATGELGQADGFSDFMAAFGRQAVQGVWLTGFTIGESGNDLLVNGRALRPELVPAYLNGLSRESMMRGRRVTELKLTAKAVPPSKSGAPQRFVEFSFIAPLRLAEPAPAKGGTP
jgi:hypothetical protein